ncbi:hypothetical protein M9H77_17057 [Catharanthus roseus]|uniref:Uncharacterized protein n=1 Tax=Catharanthus roseus TaxID=4058 RepID=A0ACC0B3I4_CATRO|nr:hypothetical protein M9H77_17057 [Catharanthus roseus]
MVEAMSDEVDDVVFTWGYSIVTYVTGGFLGIQPILNLSKSWKVPSILPIWITLLRHPVDIWNAQVLAKFFLKIGDPICADALIGTSRFNREVLQEQTLGGALQT